MPPVIIPENNKVSDILQGVPESVNPSGIAGGYNASSSFVPVGVSAYTIPPAATTFNINTTATATTSYESNFLTSWSTYATYQTTTESFTFPSFFMNGTRESSVVATTVVDVFAYAYTATGTNPDDPSGNFSVTRSASRTYVFNTHLVGWWTFAGFTRSIA